MNEHELVRRNMELMAHCLNMAGAIRHLGHRGADAANGCALCIVLAKWEEWGEEQ